MLNHINEKYNLETVLIAMEHMDTEPAKDVAALCKSNVAVISSDEFNAEEMTGILRSLDYLITTRYHAFVLSLKAGIPTLAISHDERLESIFEELGLTKEFYFDYSQITPEYLEKRVLYSVDRMIKTSPEIKAHLANAFPGFVERNDNNQKEFEKYVINKYPVLKG